MEPDDKPKNQPAKRMNHSADVFGSALVIHGGINGEEKHALKDFATYDLERREWITCIVSGKSQIGYRYMHSLTSVST